MLSGNCLAAGSSECRYNAECYELCVSLCFCSWQDDIRGEVCLLC